MSGFKLPFILNQSGTSNTNTISLKDSNAEQLLKELATIASILSSRIGIPPKAFPAEKIQTWLDSIHGSNEISKMAELFTAVSNSAAELIRVSQVMAGSEAVQGIIKDIRDGNLNDNFETILYSENSALNFLKPKSVLDLLKDKLHMSLGNGNFLVLNTGFFLKGADTKYDDYDRIIEAGEGPFMHYTDDNNNILTLRFNLIDLSGSEFSQDSLVADLKALAEYQLACETQIANQNNCESDTTMAVKRHFEGNLGSSASAPKLLYGDQLLNPSAILDLSIDCMTGEIRSTDVNQSFKASSGKSFWLDIRQNLQNNVSWISALY